MNYTQAQIDRANAVSLEDFLRTQGETLIKSGREYRWKEHDSLTVRGNKWFRHSQSKGGYPIDFVMEFYGKSFPEAVQLLTGESGEGQSEANTAPPTAFHLPLHNRTADRAIQYLCESRGLNKTLVEDFLLSGDIYEDAKRHNVVFVGRDRSGTPRYAHVRGTADPFRQDIAGSDNLLCEKADDVYGGRLPVHVRCLIDECANIGQIPKLEKLVATIRSREISACLVLQAQSQLKAIYKDNADTIIGNMDTSIFLGGKEPTTLKELAAVLGKETIDTYNTGESRGRETSHSLNYQKLGKELMSQDELAVMDGGKCILQLRGVRPFLSDKYDITRHPNFKYTADADKRNTFDIEAFLSARLKLKPDEVCDVYEVDTEGV